MPESSNRDGDYDMICIVVDQLTSMVHLIPTRHNYRAADMAELVFECAYKLRGLPERIISDRDSHQISVNDSTVYSVLNLECFPPTDR